MPRKQPMCAWLVLIEGVDHAGVVAAKTPAGAKGYVRRVLLKEIEDPDEMPEGDIHVERMWGLDLWAQVPAHRATLPSVNAAVHWARRRTESLEQAARDLRKALAYEDAETDVHPGISSPAATLHLLRASRELDA